LKSLFHGVAFVDMFWFPVCRLHSASGIHWVLLLDALSVNLLLVRDMKLGEEQAVLMGRCCQQLFLSVWKFFVFLL
jgi:hypothetical protein